jgi:PAS domain S-box-containing protein
MQARRTISPLSLALALLLAPGAHARAAGDAGGERTERPAFVVAEAGPARAPAHYEIPRPAIWGTVALLGALAVVVATLAVNVTRRRRAEQRLAATNRHLLDIIEFLPDATAVIDERKQVVAWNRAMEELTGVPKTEMLGREHFHFAVPFYGSPRPFLMDLLEKDDAQLASAYASVERRGDRLFAESFAPALHQGRGAHVWATATSLRDADGKVVGAIESIRDVTEQRRAAEAMRVANERFGAVFRASSYSIIGTDRSGTITMFSEGAERMLGYRSEEVVGKLTPIALHDPAEVAARAAELGVAPGFAAFVHGASGGRSETRDWTYIRKDGSRFPVSLTVTEMRAEDGTPIGYMGIARDVTAQRRLEQQLLQSQKMESIGQLAGGIAHDFNNLLTPITGFSELFLLDLPTGDPRHEGLREIHAAAKRAADLTRQLLAFSRKQVLELKTVRLGEVVELFGRMLRRTLGEDVRIQVSVADDLAPVRADAGQIEQVLMNLSLNARDAMPRGGVLSIDLRNARIEEENAAQAADLKPGAYVVMEVSDSGVGMAPEILAHVFEPFFSTKEAGKGTGLGLSMVYGIVRQHGGNVTVYSEPGRGTTFRVYLPRAPDRGDGERTTRTAPSRELARGMETILVVEDNDIVRDVACSMLRRLGYRVLDADGGDAALRVAFGHAAHVDLLLTDVVMPKMNGKEIFMHLNAAVGGLKVLYMSGYAASVIVNRGALDPGVHFIQKPLSLEALAFKVREVLDS